MGLAKESDSGDGPSGPVAASARPPPTRSLPLCLRGSTRAAAGRGYPGLRAVVRCFF